MARLRRHAASAAPHPRRAAVLLLVLGMIATLGWLVAEVVLTARRDIAAQATHLHKGRLRAVAWSAAESVVAALRERRLVDGDLYTVPHDGAALLAATGFVAAPGTRVTVALGDDSGKIALPALDDAGRRELFADLGAPLDVAARLADRYRETIVTDPRLAASDADAPLGRPPRDFEELLTVPGFAETFCQRDGAPNALGRDLLAAVTFTGDTRAPNINTAAPALLRHLATRGVLAEPAKLARRLAGPDGARGTDDDTHLRSDAELTLAGHGPVSSAAAFTVRRLRVAVTVHLEDAAFRLTLVLDPTAETAGFPWKILRSAENGPVD